MTFILFLQFIASIYLILDAIGKGKEILQSIDMSQTSDALHSAAALALDTLIFCLIWR